MDIKRYLLVANMVLIGGTTLLATSIMAYAEVPELFIPLPTSQFKDMSPMQTQRIDQIKQRPTTSSVTLMRVDANALKGDSTRISLPDAKTLDFAKSRIDVRSANDFTWLGALSGAPGHATIVVREGNTTGTIRSDDGSLYRIESVGNGVHALIKVDESRFPPDHPPSFKEKEKRGDAGPAPNVALDVQKADSPVGIDVLVAYTPSARSAVSDIAATIQLAVAEANQSYQNSGVNLRLTLVDTFEVSYSESGKSFDTILADFVGMSDVNNRRNGSGADLAAMIINQTDYCGLANAIMANASNAFAIVHYDCATGYYSFAHELGHLQGARHNTEVDATNTPYAYGHGYLNTANGWRTIMGYNSSSCAGGNCTRVQCWSTPLRRYPCAQNPANGALMGTAATNDNARVLNETASTVAGFRTHPLHGTDDILWQHINGQVHYWPMQNGQRQGGINIFTPVGPDWKLIGAGDFNGDGTDDILWQHINGQVHYWPMQNGQRQGGINIFTPVGPDWKLIGAGDFNGDGTDDILWQHINGQVHYWPMLNGQRQGGINIFTPVGPDWKLIGAGDFNGDRTDDILWQHVFGQVHYWPMQNGQRQGGINIFTPVGLDWKLVGAGDLNGN